MPTYSYECTQCANRFDVVQAFTDDALTTCERCSGRPAQAVQCGRRGVQRHRLLPHRQPRVGQEVQEPDQRILDQRVDEEFGEFGEFWLE